MKTPEQIMSYPKIKEEDIEKNKSHQPALHVLKETAEKFNSLNQEANVAIHEKRDVAAYKRKLSERARLLISLPGLLSGLLGGLDPEVKQRIISDTEWFATSAKKALETNNYFAIGELLTHKGNKNTDKDNLEELIALLER